MTEIEDLTDAIPIDTYVLTDDDTGEYLAVFINLKTDEQCFYGPFATEAMAEWFIGTVMGSLGAIDMTGMRDEPLN